MLAAQAPANNVLLDLLSTCIEAHHRRIASEGVTTDRHTAAALLVVGDQHIVGAAIGEGDTDMQRLSGISSDTGCRAARPAVGGGGVEQMHEAHIIAALRGRDLGKRLAIIAKCDVPTGASGAMPST